MDGDKKKKNEIFIVAISQHELPMGSDDGPA